jgi:hypothetical protein
MERITASDLASPDHATAATRRPNRSPSKWHVTGRFIVNKTVGRPELRDFSCEILVEGDSAEVLGGGFVFHPTPTFDAPTPGWELPSASSSL